MKINKKDYIPTIMENELPKDIKEIENNIFEETICCIHKGECCHQRTVAFKITPNELQFYKKMNLHIPSLYPNCRHYERLAQRNPLKL